MSEVSSASLEISPSPASFHIFAVITAVCAFVLVFAGAMVTPTGSALAVPDWPLSFGKFFPPMTGGVLFEHGHRMIAGAVAIMTWALALWAYFSRLSKPVRLLSYLIAFAILLQAILGGTDGSSPFTAIDCGVSRAAWANGFLPSSDFSGRFFSIFAV